MLGTIVNASAIAVGTLIGRVFNKKLDHKMLTQCFKALGLCCFVIGINACVNGIGKSEYPTAYILFVVLGTAIGYKLRLEESVQHRISKIEGSNSASGPSLAEGLTLAVLLFCIGTLSIVGPMMSAIQGDNTFLFTNATLDFVTSIILATTYGAGIIWAALVLFCWQGGIYLLALICGPIISQELISEITVVGGVLIFSSGFKMLGICDCKTLNMLPALALPILWQLILAAFALL